MKINRARCVTREIACVVAAVVASLCILAGCSATSTGSGTASGSQASTEASAGAAGNLTTEYTLYIGTNSQDGSGPVMGYEDAKQLIIDLALEHVGSYTIYDAQGGWTNAQGIPESEDTIVLVLVTDDEAAVHTIAREIAKALDQEAVLIQSDSATSEYYASE